MSYTVIFLREFVKQFRRLPRDVKLRVRRRVTEFTWFWVLLRQASP